MIAAAAAAGVKIVASVVEGGGEVEFRNTIWILVVIGPEAGASRAGHGALTGDGGSGTGAERWAGVVRGGLAVGGSAGSGMVSCFGDDGVVAVEGEDEEVRVGEAVAAVAAVPAAAAAAAAGLLTAVAGGGG